MDCRTRHPDKSGRRGSQLVLKLPPRGVEPLQGKSEPVDNKALTENQNLNLSTDLDKVLQKYPEIASVIAAWPELSEDIKTKIKALVSTV